MIRRARPHSDSPTLPRLLRARHLCRADVSGSVALASRAVVHLRRAARPSRRRRRARGAGKRAAFALFYGPLHYLLIRESSVRCRARSRVRPLIDLGCGTARPAPRGRAACRSPAARSSDSIDTRGRSARRAADVSSVRTGGAHAPTRCRDARAAEVARTAAGGVHAERAARRVARRAAAASVRSRGGGDRVLIVEPLARGVAPWWNRWQESGRLARRPRRRWRFRVELPAIVTKLDRAAGLNHRELTAAAVHLWLAGPPPSPHSISRSSGQQLTTRSGGMPASRACAIAVSA